MRLGRLFKLKRLCLPWCGRRGWRGMGLERHLNHLGLVVGFVGAFDPLLFRCLVFFDDKQKGGG